MMNIGAIGYLFVLFDILYVSARLTGLSLLAYFVIIFLVVYLIEKRALYMFLRWKIWLSLLIMFLLTSSLIGKKDTEVLGIWISSYGMKEGFNLGLRAIILIFATKLISKKIRVEELICYFDRFKLVGLGFSIGIGLNIISAITDCVEHTYYSAKQKGCFRRNIVFNFKLMFIRTMLNIVSLAEDVVQAAKFKGYDENIFIQDHVKIKIIDILIILLSVCVILFFIIFSLESFSYC